MDQHVDGVPVVGYEHRIEAVSPDQFGLLLMERSLGPVIASATEHWQSLRNPPKSREEYLASLARCGLVEASRVLSEHL